MKATVPPPPPGKFRYFRICPVSPTMMRILAVEFWKKLESGKRCRLAVIAARRLSFS